MLLIWCLFIVVVDSAVTITHRHSRHFTVLVPDQDDMYTNDRLCNANGDCLQLMNGCKLEHRIEDTISIDIIETSHLRMVRQHGMWMCNTDHYYHHHGNLTYNILLALSFDCLA